MALPTELHPNLCFSLNPSSSDRKQPVSSGLLTCLPSCGGGRRPPFPTPTPHFPAPLLCEGRVLLYSRCLHFWPVWPTLFAIYNLTNFLNFTHAYLIALFKGTLSLQRSSSLHDVAHDHSCYCLLTLPNTVQHYFGGDSSMDAPPTVSGQPRLCTIVIHHLSQWVVLCIGRSWHVCIFSKP